MSKSTVTRLFIGAVLAVTVGLVLGLAAVLAALAEGGVAIGGPELVTVNGGAFAGTLAWLIIASLAIAGGALAAVVAWIGALLNTVQLEDKTWFTALLVLGLVSLGWVALAAYVFAGPDATKENLARPAGATTTGT